MVFGGLVADSNLGRRISNSLMVFSCMHMVGALSHCICLYLLEINLTFSRQGAAGRTFRNYN